MNTIYLLSSCTCRGIGTCQGTEVRDIKGSRCREISTSAMGQIPVS